MLFALGYIAGLVTAAIIVIAIAFFRHPVEESIKKIEGKIVEAGPRPRGFIIEPESEAEEARMDIVKNNRKMGRDTPVKDLR